MYRIVIVILVLTALLGSEVFSQKILIGLSSEMNTMGYEQGFFTSISANNEFSVGYFYQVGLNKSEGKLIMNRELHGLLFSIPVIRGNRISVSTMIKPTLINKKFIKVIPALRTSFKIARFFGVGFDVGWRLGRPSYAFSSIFNLSI